MRQAGQPVNHRNLANALAGKTRPQRATINKILNGVGATDVERRLVFDAWEAFPERPASITIVRALGGAKEVDRGRSKETVIWRYLVGNSDERDIAIEIRKTLVGPEGLRLASFGPGQLGQLSFALENLPLIEFQVEARRVVKGKLAEKVPTFLHVVDLHPETHQYRMVVQFAGLEPGETVHWEAQYNWPGLWRSLRLGGSSSGRVRANSKDRPEVTKASVEVVADQRVFPDLELKPSLEGVEVKRRVKDRHWWLTWTVETFPNDMVFQVLAPSRRP